MPTRALSILALAAAILLGLAGAQAGTRGGEGERVVVLIMIDGFRWQEVFHGLDAELATKERGNVADVPGLLARYGGATPEERRAKLLPFLWSTVLEQGQIFGDRDHGSAVECTNGRFVSYPGYSETICGIVDPAIDSNKKVVNPNRNLFEELDSRPEFAGRVACFGCWDVFPFIFAVERNHLPVDDSIGPFVPPPGSPPVTERIATVNRMRADVPRRWPGSHFDALLAPVVLDWVKLARPRALFVGLGETDEWAHETDYAHYLDAAHRADATIAELWRLYQSMPATRGRTTFVITADHGRGSNAAGPTEWANHSTRAIGSHEMWLAILGPDVPARGLRAGGPTIHQCQIAATVTRAVGVDWQAVVPAAAPPIPLE